MKYITAIIVSLLFIGCSMRPTIENKKDFSTIFVEELNKTNKFKEKSPISEQIIYNKSILTLKDKEFTNLLKMTIDLNYGILDIWEERYKDIGDKKLTKKIIFKLEENQQIDCTLIIEQDTHFGLMKSIKCIKKQNLRKK